MEHSPYEVQDIWDVVIAASVQRMSIESGCDLLEDAPSANTVRTALKTLFTDEGLEKLEQQVNELLVARLPRKLLSKKRICAIDITEIPYHGQHDDEDERVRRSRAKSGTTHFHSFGTLSILHRHKRYTLAVTLMRKSDKALDVLKRLLRRGQMVDLRLKRLYLDRGFDNNAVVAYLKRQGFPCIIALAIRGKTGGTRALCRGRKSYQIRYRRESRQYGRQSLPLFIVCKYSKGHYRRRGLRYFAYILIGKLKMSARQVYEEYRRRFGIECSYRLMNTMRARTSSRSVTLRLFLVAVALLLLNLWCYLKWQMLFKPKPGPRQVLHHLLPLARWRLWLWEMVKRRLGFALEIVLYLEV
jgi:putative transposase